MRPNFRERVVDITPDALPERQQQVIQHPMDVTKQCTPERFIAILRALLARYPESQKIGIITHMKFTELLDESTNRLDTQERARIVKVDHFFGPESRGSNAWKEECDALFVIGTPRQPVECVKDRLLQLDELEAARRDGQWSPDYWSGRTHDGTRLTVCTKGYRDRTWNRAYRQLVHAELIQAIGRSRCYNDKGIPLTVVLTTEDLGLPLAAEQLSLIRVKDMQIAVPIFAAMLDLEPERLRQPQRGGGGGRGRRCGNSAGRRNLTARTALKYNIIEQILPLAEQRAREVSPSRISAPITGEELASMLRVSPRTVRQRLANLEALGLVARQSTRGGYYLALQNVRTLADTIRSLMPSRCPRVNSRPVGTPIPLWSPETDDLMDGDTFSLALGVSRQGYCAEVVCACAADRDRVILISRDDLPRFLERHRDRTMLLHEAAGAMVALRNTYGDLSGFYERLETLRLIDTEVAHRLEYLATTGNADTEWRSLYDCYRYYYPHVGECNNAIDNRTHLAASVLYGFENRHSTEPREEQRRKLRLVRAAGLILRIHEALQSRNRDIREHQRRSPPFGYVSGEYMDAMQERYGIGAENITLKSSLICHEVTFNGIGINVERAAVVRRCYQEQLNELDGQLLEYGYESGPGSKVVLQEILRNIEREADIRFERNRDNDIKTGADALNPYADCSPFIPTYLQATQLRSYLANYLCKMTRSRLYPEYDYLLQTGRVSNGGDLATQTVPSRGGIRECIIPTPGHVFVRVDACQMELVMLAQALQTQFGLESNLADMINEGGDIHRKVAAMMYDKDQDDVTTEQRNHAKVLNFGIPGGLGAKSISRKAKEEFSIIWTETEAKEMRDQWLNLFPEVRKFLANTGEFEGVWTLTGRFRKTSKYTELRNTIFQGLGADGMNLALKRLWLKGYDIVAVIHDEVLIEVPLCDDYTEVVADIERLMVEGMQEVASDMRICVESTVSTCWSKQAVKVHDREGRLIAWSPDSPPSRRTAAERTAGDTVLSQ